MKQKDVALIFGSIAIFTICWVAFSVWHAYTTSTIKEPLTSQLLQIPGTFNTQVIDGLKNRASVTSGNFTLQPATPSANQTVEPSSLLTPTVSAIPTPELSPVQTSTTSAGGGI